MIRNRFLPTRKINILLQERCILNNTVPELHFIVQRKACGVRKTFEKSIPQAQNTLLMSHNCAAFSFFFKVTKTMQKETKNKKKIKMKLAL